MKIRSAISVLMLTQMSAQAGSQVYRVLPSQIASAYSNVSQSAPQCEIVGTSELSITCVYSPAEVGGADARSLPRVILNRAEISFKTSNESHMRVELSFTNDSGAQINEPRTVYLAIDDEKGQNHMRRPLPQVDFTKLEPGKPKKFEETLLAPAFSPGPYVVSLWIPSSDPSWKFDPAHNFLLRSAGVPDSVTGLNLVAKFRVGPRGKRNSAAIPD
jgi:hypothetical protein